ncbi:Hint domain-containing protein, partial [Streptomyces albidoflavus]
LLAAAERARVAAEKAAAAARAAAKKAAQAAKKKAAEARAAATRAAKEAQKKTGNAVQKAAKTNATKTAAKTQSTTARKQSKGDDSSGPGKNRKPDEHEGASEGGSCPINKTDNSFTPGTAVMMADGTTKPIEDVAIGDTVLTTDPETGETSPQKVTATITGKGTKHLVDITLHTTDPESEAETESGTKSAGGKDPAPTTLTATDGHPFWVPQLDTWIDAADLNTGQYLQKLRRHPHPDHRDHPTHHPGHRPQPDGRGDAYVLCGGGIDAGPSSQLQRLAESEGGEYAARRSSCR